MSDTKEKIDVMQAFIDGEIVEYCWRSEADNFMRLQDSAWNWKECDYRIKKEPEYIPFDFSDAEFLIGKAVRFKITDIIGIVVEVKKAGITIGENGFFSFAALLNLGTFLNSSPCGELKK